MYDVGQLQRFDSARKASGVPPIASEICALQDGSKGHFQTIARQQKNSFLPFARAERPNTRTYR
jgi:hypothetical protein